MREIVADLAAWHADDVAVGLGTVVDTWKSAPRQAGAAMAVGDGRVVGSVSGGCVEGAVVEVAERVVRTGVAELVHYGVSDDEAFAVGLTCGGELDVLVERVDRRSMPSLGEVADAILTDRPVAVATVLPRPDGAPLPSGPQGTPAVGAKLVVGDGQGSVADEGSLGTEGLDVAVTDDARGMLGQGLSGVRRYGPAGERRLDDVAVFVESFAPRPRMLVYGAIDFGAAVVRVGALLGYHVTVCDARPVFATRARFPEADDVVVSWPHRHLKATHVDGRTVICVLTHDPKFDVPLLEVALSTPAAYVGAMGSRRTHDDRLARLRERGVADDVLARLRSPIGLDLGARTPEETAVSIAAEIVAHRWGGTGRPLTATSGAIHRPTGSMAPA